jgi:hypothetical protein
MADPVADVDAERPSKVGDLEVTEVEDGLVIYQARPERVHVLNQTASFVFDLCSGDRSIEEIAEEMRVMFRMTETPRDAVAQCVAELRGQHLLR